MEDTLAYDGGAVKALGGGKVGGYLVLFSGPEDADLQGDYFTKSTDFFIDSGDQRPILYRHGVHPAIKSRKLGRAKMTIDEVGIFIEGELELRDKYEKAIYTLAEQGKLGWSSGSMAHLVTKIPNGKSFEIESWPIGEASLTPTPVEGRTNAFPLKSLEDEKEIDFDAVIKEIDQAEYDQQFSLEGTPSLKALCDAVAPSSRADGQHRSRSAANAAKEFVAIARIMGEAHDSYAARLVKRTENRFLKEDRQIDAATVSQVEQSIGEINEVISAMSSVKESLSGIKKLSDLSLASQQAMSEKARFELWNFLRISGKTPNEV